MRRSTHNSLKRAWHEMNYAVILKNCINIAHEHYAKRRRYAKWSAKIMTLIRSHTNSEPKPLQLRSSICTQRAVLIFVTYCTHSESFVMEKILFICRMKSSQLCEEICFPVTAAVWYILYSCNMQHSLF